MLFKIDSATMHLGVLRRLETLQIDIKDVVINDLVSAEDPHATKHRKKVLSFKFPGWLVSPLTKHIGQFKMILIENCRFMRNHDSKSKTRVQNMGEGQISKFSAVLA